MVKTGILSHLTTASCYTVHLLLTVGAMQISGSKLDMQGSIIFFQNWANYDGGERANKLWCVVS